MDTIVKIKGVNLSKLNNAEYTQFLSYTKELIEKATLDKLGLEELTFKKFKENIELLTDASQQSRISTETKELENIDKQRNEILSFLFMNFRSEQKNPIEARKKAGTELYNITKPYNKIKSLPVRQKTQNIEGLITDITKEETNQYLKTLGIIEVVKKLSEVNNQYKKLTANRADNQAAILKINIKQLRNETNVIYDGLITRAFVSSVAFASVESDLFVKSMNKLITDTLTAYKQRQKQKREKQSVSEVPVI